MGGSAGRSVRPGAWADRRRAALPRESSSGTVLSRLRGQGLWYGYRRVAPAIDATPRVLLGALDPILRVGVVRALLDAGVSVIDGAAEADALVERAASSAPDAVVLSAAAADASGAGLRARLRAAAPVATLVIWRTDAQLIEVLAPGASVPRLMTAPAADQLAHELFGDAADRGGSRPAT